jgi:hypothetical protein
MSRELLSGLASNSAFEILRAIEEGFPNGIILNPSGEVLDCVDGLLDFPL